MADTDNKESERPPVDVSPMGVHRIEPTWRVDGYGIRGPQDERVKERAIPFPMEFGISEPHTGIGGGSGTIDVACEPMAEFGEGETLVVGVDKITFDSSLFKIHDNGGGEVQVELVTEECTT